jgi:hypothetical protein
VYKEEYDGRTCYGHTQGIAWILNLAVTFNPKKLPGGPKKVYDVIYRKSV